MGCYESIKVPCPGCGEAYWAQSKSGPCVQDTYSLVEAPDDVVGDVNRHAPFRCEGCGTVFEVKLTYSITREVVRCAPGTKGKWD